MSRKIPTVCTRYLASTLLLALLGCATPTPPETQTSPTPRSTPATTRYERVEIQVNRQAGQCHVQLTGQLDEYTARSLRQTMNELASQDCRSKRVVIALQGGQVGSALTVGAIIKNRAFDTQVQAGTSCLTPCLLVFAAGRERIMLPSVPPTRLGFSQIPPDADFGRGICETELNAAQAQTLTRYLRAMLPLPVANTVMKKLATATCNNTEYLNPAEALALGLATTVR